MISSTRIDAEPQPEARLHAIPLSCHSRRRHHEAPSTQRARLQRHRVRRAQHLPQDRQPPGRRPARRSRPGHRLGPCPPRPANSSRCAPQSCSARRCYGCAGLSSSCSDSARTSPRSNRCRRTRVIRRQHHHAPSQRSSITQPHPRHRFGSHSRSAKSLSTTTMLALLRNSESTRNHRANDPYFGAIRIAPSRRIVSPFNMAFSTM